MTTEEFNVGDSVKWKSQSNGSTTIKTGKIICIVPSSTRPLRGLFTSTHKVMFDGCFRDHKSYLVEIQHTGNGKPTLYHPRVSQLKK